MIDRLSVVDECLHVHAKDGSLKTTKSFTHGAIILTSNRIRRPSAAWSTAGE
jgi:hypothetical protein